MSRIFLFPSFFLPMTISFGSFMYFLVIEAISFGMVAEKSSILRFSGIAAKISLILSVKPMFNISSASSRMTFFTLLKSTVLRFIKSIKRPGVGHYHVYASLQCLDLALYTGTSVYRENLQVIDVFRIIVQIVRYL